MENIQKTIKVKIRDKTLFRINGFELLTMAAFFAESLLIYIRAVILRLPLGDFLATAFFPTIFVMLILASRNVIKRRIKIADIVFIIVLLCVVYGSYYLYSANREYYNEHNINLLFFNAIPFYLLGICFEPSKRMMDVFQKASYVTIVVNILYLPFYLSTRQMSDDSMWWAYLMLLPTLISLYSIFQESEKKGHVLPILFSCFGLIYIISMGTRGPMLVAVVYLGISFFLKSRKKIWAKIIFSFVILSVVFILLSGYYIVLLQIVIRMLSSLGLSTRSLDLLLSGEFISHTSNRDVIYEQLQARLRERPFIGYGVFGEWQFIKYSAHNVYLELCMHYGYVFGSLALVTHVLLAIKAYRVTGNRIAKDLIVLFACFTYIRGIFGGDYLNMEFAFLLGLSINEIRKAKYIGFMKRLS